MRPGSIIEWGWFYRLQHKSGGRYNSPNNLQIRIPRDDRINHIESCSVPLFPRAPEVEMEILAATGTEHRELRAGPLGPRDQEWGSLPSRNTSWLPRS